MSKVLVNASTLTAIANAIRSKTETTEALYPREMAAAIEEITSGSDNEAVVELLNPLVNLLPTETDERSY